jgi:hypothetical protein
MKQQAALLLDCLRLNEPHVWPAVVRVVGVPIIG